MSNKLTSSIVMKDTPLSFSPPQIDVGYGSNVNQSSVLNDDPAVVARKLVPTAQGMNDFFFHTALEQEPYIVVDLGRNRCLGRVVVWNRGDGSVREVTLRSVPLVLSVSFDGIEWREVAVYAEPFGGLHSACPAVFYFSFGLKARYVKISVRNNTFLHLYYIGIFQFIPKLRCGIVDDLRKNQDGSVSCKYILNINHGLYSNISVALDEMLQLSKCGISVHDIDFSLSFQFFKNYWQDDAYSLFFKRAESLFWNAAQDIEFEADDVHRPYNALPLEQLQKIAFEFFSPSDKVRETAAMLISSAGIIPDKTISIVYRSTDKSTEVVVAPIESYIEAAHEILNEYPDFDVLIQTDQSQARDKVLAAFGEKCKFFQSLPVTDSNTAIHNLQFGTEVIMDRELFTTHMIAATLNISKCRFVVNHSGNVGLWIMIYRGHSEGVYQFDASGNLLRLFQEA